MKLFLSKIGKSCNMIKKNGILNGGKIVLKYWITFLKSFFVNSGDILFVTGGVGDSAHYRAYNQAEELRLHGLRCSVTNLENPFLPKYADKFNIFIFHRTIYTKGLAKLVGRIKEQQKEIIFDTDDLVFDPKFLPLMDYYQKMSKAEKEVYKNGIGAELIADNYVKVCSTTTSFLAKKLEEKGKKVFIAKNKISIHEEGIVDGIIKKTKPEDGYVKVGYYSGTHSHNKDFSTITPALYEILKKFDNTKLISAGPLDVDNKLNEFGYRIMTLPRVSRDRYYENLYLADINLAPLERNNSFCEAKSEIKFSEAGIVGIPTVAIRNQTFSETIEDGVDGFLADNTSEWMEKIGKLIEDKNLREEMGEKARKKVLRDYTNKNSHNEEYYNYLKSKL